MRLIVSTLEGKAIDVPFSDASATIALAKTVISSKEGFAVSGQQLSEAIKVPLGTCLQSCLSAPPARAPFPIPPDPFRSTPLSAGLGQDAVRAATVLPLGPREEEEPAHPALRPRAGLHDMPEAPVARHPRQVRPHPGRLPA